MFALRIIEKTRENEKAPYEQVVENHEIGVSYSVLRKGFTKEFEKEMSVNYPDVDYSNILGLLCSENGRNWFIEAETVNRRCEYYIMSDSGKTFEHL